MLLSDNSEFDSKPELEIYADDVKCSHGSTSGSIDENSIYYLMTRGLNRKESVKLLVNGFLNEVIEVIKSNSMRKFVQSKLERQIYGPIIILSKSSNKIKSRKVLNIQNQENKKLILSINCDTNELDVRIPGRKWRGSQAPKEEFEKNLINDFC